MKSVFSVLVIALGVLTFTTPSNAESRLATIRYAKSGLHMGEDGIRTGETTLLDAANFAISTANDRDWQLTANGCVLNILPDETTLTDDDKAFRSSFIQGFSDANNPNGHQMVFAGKAAYVRQIPAKDNSSFSCDNNHIYWVGILRMPVLPGKAGIMILPLDGYKAQDTYTLIGIVKPDVFLQHQTLTAEQLGPVTTALNKALH